MRAEAKCLRAVVYGCSNVPDIENGILLHKIPYDQDLRPEAIKLMLDETICNDDFSDTLMREKLIRVTGQEKRFSDMATRCKFLIQLQKLATQNDEFSAS